MGPRSRCLALGDQRSARFDLATSPDGSAWTTRWRGLSSGQTTGKESCDIADVTARQVRITGHGSTASRSITEVSVHRGSGSGRVLGRSPAVAAPELRLEARRLMRAQLPAQREDRAGELGVVLAGLV